MIGSARTLIEKSRARVRRATLMEKGAQITRARSESSVALSTEVVKRHWPMAIETPSHRPEAVDNPLFSRLDDIWERVRESKATLETEVKRYFQSVRGGEDSPDQ